MQIFVIQDPKTFDKPNTNLIIPVIEQYNKRDKEKFLSMYYQLSNTDKLYSLVYIIESITDIKPAKDMLLDELKPDLSNLKQLNMPNGKDFGFGYNYRGIWFDEGIWSGFTQLKNDINENNRDTSLLNVTWC